MKKIGFAIGAMALFTIFFAAYTILYRQKQLAKLEKMEMALGQSIASRLDDKHLSRQIFLLYLPLKSSSRTSDSEFDTLVDSLAPGAILINNDNIPVFRETGEQNLKKLKTQIEKLNGVYRDRGLPAPIYAIDQEGGEVRRIKSNKIAFPSALAVGEAAALTGRHDLPMLMGFYSCYELRQLGIHWSLSPVADVLSNVDNPVIKSRSFGPSPDEVAENVGGYITGLHSARCIEALKHFPGHGHTAKDSHNELPRVEAEREVLEGRELAPFRELLSAGGKGRVVMSSHVVFPEVDSSPSTFSHVWLSDILRGEWGFEGLVVTDDLAMGGSLEHAGEKGYDSIFVESLKAGADVLLFIGSLEESQRAVNSIEEALQSGELSRERLEESAARLIAAKIRTGALDSYLHQIAAELDPALQEAVEFVTDHSLDEEEQIKVLESQLAKVESINDFASRAAIKTVWADESFFQDKEGSGGVPKNSRDFQFGGVAVGYLRSTVYSDLPAGHPVMEKLNKLNVATKPLHEVVDCKTTCPLLHSGLGQGKREGMQALLKNSKAEGARWIIFSIEAPLPAGEYIPYLSPGDIYVSAFSRTRVSGEKLAELFLEADQKGLPARSALQLQ